MLVWPLRFGEGPVILVGADAWLYGLLPHSSTVEVGSRPNRKSAYRDSRCQPQRLGA
jgi:hypothetical protein